MAVMEISVVPVGTGDPCVSEYVSYAYKFLKEKGYHFQLTAMGVIVQGEVEELLQLALEIHRRPFEKGALRVVTAIKIDERKDTKLTVEGKVSKLKKSLQ
ncbi:MTH1187 family thiamine-binding protein [Desulfurobacterium sp.]